MRWTFYHKIVTFTAAFNVRCYVDGWNVTFSFYFFRTLNWRSDLTPNRRLKWALLINGSFKLLCAMGLKVIKEKYVSLQLGLFVINIKWLQYFLYPLLVGISVYPRTLLKIDIYARLSIWVATQAFSRQLSISSLSAEDFGWNWPSREGIRTRS